MCQLSIRWKLKTFKGELLKMQIVVSNIVLQVLSLQDFWQLLKMMNSTDLFFFLIGWGKQGWLCRQLAAGGMRRTYSAIGFLVDAELLRNMIHSWRCDLLPPRNSHVLPNAWGSNERGECLWWLYNYHIQNATAREIKAILLQGDDGEICRVKLPQGEEGNVAEPLASRTIKSGAERLRYCSRIIILPSQKHFKYMPVLTPTTRQMEMKHLDGDLGHLTALHFRILIALGFHWSAETLQTSGRHVVNKQENEVLTSQLTLGF